MLSGEYRALMLAAWPASSGFSMIFISSDLCVIIRALLPDVTQNFSGWVLLFQNAI
jgi:hypothetical protein